MPDFARQVPRDLGYLLLSLPIVTVAFSLLITGVAAGVGTAIVYLGVFVLLGTLFAARAFGSLERARLGWTGREPIAGPEWSARTPGLVGILKSVYGNGHYWLHLLHGAIVNFIVGVVSWVLAVVWVAVSLGGVTYWIWARFLPQNDQNWRLSEIIADFVSPGWAASIDPILGDNLVYFGAGVVFLLTLPVVSRGLVNAHHAIARGLLSGRAAI